MNLRIIQSEEGICYIEGVYFDGAGNPMIMAESGLEICTETLEDMHELIRQLMLMLLQFPEPIKEKEFE